MEIRNYIKISEFKSFVFTKIYNIHGQKTKLILSKFWNVVSPISMTIGANLKIVKSCLNNQSDSLTYQITFLRKISSPTHTQPVAAAAELSADASSPIRL